ncbi:helix-turn-helix domain-containing protein [Trinickia terrae]|uniref:helix-turn-helix domain-containing protein n=1 Tax=Trinickia terrae TaxID=2571161 RepID=UPI001F0FE6E7|nr:XRE family transcriptional regulator [Trinickia terrae]
MSSVNLYSVEPQEPRPPAHLEIDSNFIQAYRKKVKESQKRFWSRFGVTQSRGSRFELGASIPKPVMILLRLYFEKIISEDDISYVSQVRPQARWPKVISQDLSSPFGSP